MLCKLEWIQKISHSHSTFQVRKQNVPELLPCTSDLITFRTYLKREQKSFTGQLGLHANYTIWNQLAIVTLANIVFFNKCKSGETSTLHVEVFQSSQMVPCWSASIYITPLQLELCKQLTLIHTPGKFRRTVTILMHASDVRAIELLIKHRFVVGVGANNPHVLARVLRKSNEHLR